MRSAPSGLRAWTIADRSRPRRYLGLISGTSVDTVDAVVVSSAPDDEAMRLEHALGHPIPGGLKRDLLAAAADGHTGLSTIARLDVEVGRLFSEAALAVIHAAGRQAGEITAVGSHGQTVWHEPESPWPSTVQLGDPNIIAQRTGITTVADFRRRDMAAGGQGAPLAPAFHQALMAHPTKPRLVVNLGGIANVSVLDPSASKTSGPREGPLGFDCGPANGLLDAWTRRHLDAPLDRDGNWAAQGTVHGSLLTEMLSDPYFSRKAPKSTGRGYFDEGWIDRRIHSIGEAVPAVDVQRTLCELTAVTVARSIEKYGRSADEVFVCGGGVYNRTLFDRLAARLAPRTVGPTDELGIPADYVEAMAFAWLARCALEGATGNRPSVTGASGAVVLGGIYPGRGWPGRLPPPDG